MASKNHNSPIWISTIAWLVIFLTLALLFFNFVLVNQAPGLLRPVSLSLRTGFGLVIPAAALILYTLFQLPGRLGKILGFAGVMLLFALGLAGLWASGGTQSILLSGLIPLSDAVNYYIDAQRILNGIDISNFSAMRPFFPGFLSLILWVTGRNLMVALSILTALAGISSYLASREIQRTHGAETAIFFLMMVFLYFRHHSGTTMSESLAVPVSLLGASLLWKGIANKHERTFLSGLTLLAFALNIRPGAMFVLPAVLLWGGFFFRNGSRFSGKFFLIGSILVIVVFVLNNLIIKALAGPDATAFSNFSWALFGLVSGGKSWTYIFEVHPEVFSLSASMQGRAIVELILQQFLQNPSLALQGAINYWRIFFSSTWYNAYAFASGENYWVNEAARYGLYLLCGLGLWKWFKDRNDPYTGLAIVGALGVLASVPFVPPTDAYRVRLYAATIPFFVFLPGVGLSYLVDKLPLQWFRKKLVESDSYLIESFSIGLITCLFLAPMLQNANSMPRVAEAACPVGLKRIVIRFDKGTSVNILRENVSFLDWMPNYHMSVFRNNAHDLAEISLTERVTAINPPASLFYALDLLSNREALVMIDTGQALEAGALNQICGTWDETPQVANYNLFHAEMLASP